jgi:hypothetical protein
LPIHFQKREETIGKIRSTIDCNAGNLRGYRLLSAGKQTQKQLLGLLFPLLPRPHEAAKTKTITACLLTFFHCSGHPEPSRPPQGGRKTAMAVAAAYDSIG